MSIGVASICRLPICTGLSTVSPSNLNARQRKRHTGKFRSFLILALKANPNVLECLYTPLVEKATPLANELLAMRSSFLSRLVYQTYNGYVMSQFKKMQADIRNQGQVKWKHVMHLIRLLISGIRVLRDGVVPVEVGDHRVQLLAVKRGEVPWEETERWRLSTTCWYEYECGRDKRIVPLVVRKTNRVWSYSSLPCSAIQSARPVKQAQITRKPPSCNLLKFFWNTLLVASA